MTKVKIECVKVDCVWETEEELELAKFLLDKHIQVEHTPVPPQTTMATLPQVTHPQAERVKRPSLTFSGSTLEQEDFEHFKHLFSLYKERLGGNQDNAKLLNDCLATDVSRAVFSSLGPAMSSMPETDLMDAISTCCVTKQTLH